MNEQKDKAWARIALRAAIARAVRALESEITIELRLVQDAKKRLGVR